MDGVPRSRITDRIGGLMLTTNAVLYASGVFWDWVSPSTFNLVRTYLAAGVVGYMAPIILLALVINVHRICVGDCHLCCCRKSCYSGRGFPVHLLQTLLGVVVPVSLGLLAAAGVWCPHPDIVTAGLIGAAAMDVLIALATWDVLRMGNEKGVVNV